MARSPDSILRLFYGIVLPPPIQQEIAGLQERLRGCDAQVKWVEPRSLHITLQFLGELPARALGDVKLAGASVAAELTAWDLQLKGLGAFPKLQRPQTLWVGVGQGAEALALLGTRLGRVLQDQALLACDTSKPFHGHCTLGRVKQERGVRPLVEQMQHEMGFTAGPFRCDQFQLMVSELTASGPKYTVRASHRLGGCG